MSLFFKPLDIKQARVELSLGCMPLGLATFNPLGGGGLGDLQELFGGDIFGDLGGNPFGGNNTFGWRIFGDDPFGDIFDDPFGEGGTFDISFTDIVGEINDCVEASQTIPIEDFELSLFARLCFCNSDYCNELPSKDYGFNVEIDTGLDVGFDILNQNTSDVFNQNTSEPLKCYTPLIGDEQTCENGTYCMKATVGMYDIFITYEFQNI